MGMGCAALSHYLTPADIDARAVEYTVEAGIATPEQYTGFGNLIKAHRLAQDVDHAHAQVQFDLVSLMQKDTLRYSQLRGTVTQNLQAAQQREDLLFGESGLLTLGLTAAGAGGLAGFAGLMRKRPGDLTPEELQAATADLSKQRQQLVLGVHKMFKTVEEFRTIDPGASELEHLDQKLNVLREMLITRFKADLDAAEDTDTQIAVSTVKKELGLS